MQRAAALCLLVTLAGAQTETVLSVGNRECSLWELTSAAVAATAADASWCSENCYNSDGVLLGDCNLLSNENAWCKCTRVFCTVAPPETEIPTKLACLTSTGATVPNVRRNSEALQDLDLAPEETEVCTPRTAPPATAATDANGCPVATNYPTERPTDLPTSYPTKAATPPPPNSAEVYPATVTQGMISSPAIKAVYDLPVTSKSPAQIASTFVLNVVITFPSAGGLPSVAFTVTQAAVVTDASGSAATGAVASSVQQVTLKATVDILAILADLGLYKLAYTIAIALSMGVNPDQVSGLKFMRSGGGFFGRDAVALTSSEEVDITFQICARLGCAAASTDYAIGIPPDVARLPLVTQALLRPATSITYSDIVAILTPGSVLRSDPAIPVAATGGLPPVLMTVVAAPTMNSVVGTKMEGRDGGLSFFYPVQMDWLAVVPQQVSKNIMAAKELKTAYQLVIADKLMLNPLQVTSIRFVRSGTTFHRRGQAMAASERISIDQVICPDLCAWNADAATPEPGTSDDDSSLIVICVIVPVFVIGIILLIYFCMCHRKQELRDNIARLKAGKEARQEMHEPAYAGDEVRGEANIEEERKGEQEEVKRKEEVIEEAIDEEERK